ncbi:hypothetical protein DXT90_07950 [Agrobacterium tumefaciens]|nr:hypothetical protein [Agrobacterium tumefaciens]
MSSSMSKDRVATPVEVGVFVLIEPGWVIPRPKVIFARIFALKFRMSVAGGDAALATGDVVAGNA